MKCGREILARKIKLKKKMVTQMGQYAIIFYWKNLKKISF